MNRSTVRERERETAATAPAVQAAEPAESAAPPPLPAAQRSNGVDGLEAADTELHSPEVHRQLPVFKPHERAVRQRLRRRQASSERFARELEEMRVVHDLADIDDDVEAAATLYEWEAEEHTHRPKPPLWFAGLAAGTTVLAGIQLLAFANFMGAITIGVIGGFMYFLAQQRPGTARYRIMVDGIAINALLYHWQDLDSFNVIYEPDQTKTVIFRSQKTFSPHLHMEIGDADPVELRRILLEFLPEDQDLLEPLADIVARRLGF